MTSRMVKIAAATGVAGALALGGAAWAIAGGGDDSGSVRGPGADRAKAAAIAALGGGTANAVERDNEGGATWEVEVTKPNGTTVDVRLDANYKLLVVDGDSESPDDQPGAGDD